MVLSNKHKALFITFLISGTVILGMFNLHIRQNQGHIAETYYEILPEEKILEEEILKQLAQEHVKAETNNAFNQNKKSQRFAQAFKRIAPPEDYVRPDLSAIDEGSYSNKINSAETSRIDKEERHSFSKVNEILDKQLEDDINNDKSSISYSLVNRKHRYLPTPIYLCENSGRIVISITVNTAGKVIETNYNNASGSANQCLIEHALEYAKKARFNSDYSKTSQIGSITFYFEEKR